MLFNVVAFRRIVFERGFALDLNISLEHKFVIDIADLALFFLSPVF